MLVIMYNYLMLVVILDFTNSRMQKATRKLFSGNDNEDSDYSEGNFEDIHELTNRLVMANQRDRQLPSQRKSLFFHGEGINMNNAARRANFGSIIDFKNNRFDNTNLRGGLYGVPGCRIAQNWNNSPIIVNGTGAGTENGTGGDAGDGTVTTDGNGDGSTSGAARANTRAGNYGLGISVSVGQSVIQGPETSPASTVTITSMTTSTLTVPISTDTETTTVTTTVTETSTETTTITTSSQ